MIYRSHWHCVFDLQYHLVLVTKYRRKALSKQILNDLKTICENVCQMWDIELKEFGGEADHVHLLLSAHPSLQMSKFVNNLKTVTSRLIRKNNPDHMKKYYWKPVLWTRAYCLLTTDGAPLEVIKKYIENQGKKDGNSSPSN